MQKENILLCLICLLLFTGCFTTKNFDPILKDEILRLVKQPIPVIKSQDPIVGLQIPKTQVLIPGMMETKKSNLSIG